MRIEIPSPARSKKLVKVFGISLYALPAIILPTGALIAELFMHICGEVFFDPIPTSAHVALVALVPLANLLALRVLERNFAHAALCTYFIGAASAISLCYSILFIPLMPFAAMYTVFSIGALFLPAVLTILPFAPLASFLCTLRAYSRLRSETALSRKQSRTLVLTGFLCGLLSLTFAELPRFITTSALRTLSLEPQNLEAIHWLRRAGDTESILLAAYGDTSGLKDFRTWISSVALARRPWMFVDSHSETLVQPTEARAIYYRVTGKNFNEVPRPSRATGFGFMHSDTGGKIVGERSEDVLLLSSSLDGSLSAQTMSSYLEWTMVFRNDHEFFQEEARAEIALPPGGVVSRVTLWINGEEVEALLGSRAEARKAYEKVVFRNRDPLLVTSSGPDRVLIQCFPIPPKGGEMKIRIGITSPLVVGPEKSSGFRLPAFLSENFRLPQSSTHHVWIESKSAFRTNLPATLTVEQQDGVFKARGEISVANPQLRSMLIQLADPIDTSALSSADGAQIIQQKLVEKHYPGASELIVVIDGSQKSKPYLADLIAALRSSVKGKKAFVLFADDGVEKLTEDFVEMDEQSLDALMARLRSEKFSGGVDGVLALRAALNLQQKHSAAPIVWIHSDKPVAGALESIEQFARRSGGQGAIYSVPLDVQVDRLDEQLSELGLLADIPLGIKVRNISELLNTLAHGGPYWSLERTAEVTTSGSTGLVEYPHVNRLWGAARVAELLRNSFGQRDGKTIREDALNTALRYRIVTAVSGAVVLEKSDASQAANLSPAEPGKVPAVPEPETVWLLAIALLIVLLYRAQMRYRLEH